MRIHAILAVLLCGAGPGMSRPADNSRHRPAITIRVVNESAADARTISLARKEAMRIFAEAGIDLVWLDCDLAGSESGTGNACHQDRGPPEFWVRIVMRRPTATSGDVLGFAEIDERLGTGPARSSPQLFHTKSVTSFWAPRRIHRAESCKQIGAGPNAS